MNMKYFAVMLTLSILMLTGCAGLPVPGMTPDPYESLSQEEADNLRLREKNMVRVNNPELEGYLNRVFARLYTEEELASREIRVALVSKPQPGASIMEDGLVIWYLGTFDYVNSEDEIAAILAHEMTHLVAGHHETNKKGSLTDKFMAAGETAALFSGAGSAAELWAAASTARWASDSVLFPSFTSEQETDADVEAAKVLVAAGYNADAVRAVLGVLRKFFGDEAEFHSAKMVGVTSHETADNGTRLNIRIDPDAVIGNIKGYAENQWGRAYESFTLRETAVREMLMSEYPGRQRGQFMVSTHRSVVDGKDTKKWLDAHRVGFELIAMDVREQDDVPEFLQLVGQLQDDPLTSDVFDYEIVFNAALKNDLTQLAADIAMTLMSSETAVLDHYLQYGAFHRQQGNYEQALAAYSAADEIFPSSLDKVIVPLILATKDDAGMKQGSTALRCLDPTLMTACLYRK